MQRPASMTEIRDLTNTATLGPCEEAHEHWHVRALDSRPVVWERDRLLAALDVIVAARRLSDAELKWAEITGLSDSIDDKLAPLRVALDRWASLTDGSQS